MSNCPYAKKCGGCQLQNLSYEQQLSHKQVKVIRLVGKLCHVEEIIGMENPYRYRNKATRAFSFQRGKGVQGLYQSATEQVLPIEDCLLEDALAGKIASTALKLAALLGIQLYDLDTGKGNLRTLLLRRSGTSGEVMAVIVTKSDKFPQKEAFAERLLAAHPEITDLVWNVNSTDTPVFLGPKSQVLHGKGYITDYLCGLEFRISPASFYQVNPLQTEILYGKVKEFACLTGKETVLDAYYLLRQTTHSTWFV